ncbi:nitrile hydratase accessory protein [Geminicoccus roseus]|uniref:nitrile hydratase accessory protein n=1 Tax=Geminicoccus roseus TaxID=404900 RepID=UPI0003F7D0BD|nr:nitrile hydratase accessory protein [Geminicoccus roseus]
MSPADPDPAQARLPDEAGLAASERPFTQPWHAQAFALAVELSRGGLFTWPEWAERFSAVIASAPQQPGEDANDAYYRQWLSALEDLVIERQACAAAEIDACQSAWRQAYLRTPHGEPVELTNAGRHDHGDHHHHGHDHGRHPVPPAPVAVAPARGG